MQAQFEKTTLPNGVRVLTERVADTYSASVGLWFEAGCAHETEAEGGLAHLLEHMVFKGTRRHSMRAIAAMMDDLGGGMNAFTEREFVCFHVKVLGEHLRPALSLLCEFAAEPLLDAELLEVEKGVVLEEIRGALDAPEERVEDLFLEQMWPSSAWGRPILGQSETVAGLTSENLRAFMNRFYSPSRCVVAVAGDVSHAQVVAWADKFLRDLPASEGATALETPPLAPAHNHIERDDTEGVHLLLGAPSFGARDERCYALWLLDSILTGGYSSRLFQEIREKRGLCYSLGGASANFRAGGYWALETSVAPENARKTLALIGRELHKIREKRRQRRGTQARQTDGPHQFVARRREFGFAHEPPRAQRVHLGCPPHARRNPRVVRARLVGGCARRGARSVPRRLAPTRRSWPCARADEVGSGVVKRTARTGG